jgi:predicted metal-dependent enzyme (double-stranded beta helix superfamily)
MYSQLRIKAVHGSEVNLAKESNAMAQGREVFDRFVQDLRAAWGAVQDVESRMKRSAKLLEGLVSNSALRESSKTWPSTEGPPIKNLLLYQDPDYGFAINAVVRTPGRKGRAHDHGESWTAYGLLDGSEKLEHYRRLDDGKKEGYAEIELDYVDEGAAGKVDLVAPFAIHAEVGGPARSVAVIIRSLPIGQRGYSLSFDGDKKTSSHGNGPTQIRFEID